MPIIRITSVQVPREEDISSVLKGWEQLEKTATKDGAAYILSVKAHATIDDARNQGYNVVAFTTFADQADMQYYEEHCAAHDTMKKNNADKVTPPALIQIINIEDIK